MLKLNDDAKRIIREAYASLDEETKAQRRMYYRDKMAKLREDPEYVKKVKIRFWNKPVSEEAMYYGFRRVFLIAEAEYNEKNPRPKGRPRLLRPPKYI